MKNSLNNVDRGMNVAVVDGKTGHLDKIGVFDLYSKGCLQVAFIILKLFFFSCIVFKLALETNKVRLLTH